MTIDNIRLLLKNDLPGEKAQIKMAPSNRSEAATMFNQNHLRNSSVLILLYPKNEQLYIPFILRPIYNGAHSGQIGLPGGKSEPFDNTLLDTALRETYEEIGIRAKDIEILGQLTPLYIPHSNFNVFPFVGFCKTNPIFSPDPIEVAKIIEAPLQNLLLPDTVQYFEHSVENENFTAPFFNIDNYQIWGATAMMISELKEILLNEIS